MVMINKNMNACLAISYAAGIMPQRGLTLCVGTMPTDAQAKTLSSSLDATLITPYITVTYTSILGTWGANRTVVKDATLPALFYADFGPVSAANRSKAATKAGVISWAVASNDQGGFVILDVGLPNSGAIVQVDTVNVSVGTIVTLLSLSCKLGA